MRPPALNANLGWFAIALAALLLGPALPRSTSATKPPPWPP